MYNFPNVYVIIGAEIILVSLIPVENLKTQFKSSLGELELVWISNI